MITMSAKALFQNKQKEQARWFKIIRKEMRRSSAAWEISAIALSEAAACYAAMADGGDKSLVVDGLRWIADDIERHIAADHMARAFSASDQTPYVGDGGDAAFQHILQRLRDAPA